MYSAGQDAGAVGATDAGAAEGGGWADSIGGAGNGMSLVGGAINAVGQIICSGLSYGTKKLQMENAEAWAKHNRDLKLDEIKSKEETMHAVEAIQGRNMKQAERLAKLQARSTVLDAQIASQKRIADETHVNVTALKAEFSRIRDMRSEYYAGHPVRSY